MNKIERERERELYDWFTKNKLTIYLKSNAKNKIEQMKSRKQITWRWIINILTNHEIHHFSFSEKRIEISENKIVINQKYSRIYYCYHQTKIYYI
jgi:hypothetical protein